MSPTGNTRENTSWSYFVEALKKNTADESFLPKLLSRYFRHSWQTYEFHTPVIVISIKHTQQNQTQFRPQSTLPTVDGRNSANQLRLVVHPIIYEFFTSKRWLFGISEPSTVPWTYHPMTILTTTWPWSFPPNDNSQHKSGDQDISHDWSHHPCNLRESTHGMDFVKTVKLGSIFWGGLVNDILRDGRLSKNPGQISSKPTPSSFWLSNPKCLRGPKRQKPKPPQVPGDFCFLQLRILCFNVAVQTGGKYQNRTRSRCVVPPAFMYCIVTLNL